MDTFFTQKHCDRCRGPIGVSRTMSWFTEECLCSKCMAKEDELKKSLREEGVDIRPLEGCGYIPTLKNKEA